MNYSAYQNISEDLKEAFVSVVNRNGYLVVPQFAQKYGLNTKYTQKLCREKRIQCWKFRGRWLIPQKQKFQRYKHFVHAEIIKSMVSKL